MVCNIYRVYILLFYYKIIFLLGAKFLIILSTIILKNGNFRNIFTTSKIVLLDNWCDIKISGLSWKQNAIDPFRSFNNFIF